MLMYTETETTDNFFLRCQNYVSFRITVMNESSSVNCEIVSLRPIALLEVILYGDKMLNDKSPNIYCDYQLH